MKSLLYIFLFLLLISLHLNIGGWFVESQGLFYIASLGVLLLSAILMRKGFCIGKGECLISILCTYILIQMVVRGHEYGSYWIFSVAILWLLFFAFKNLFHQNRLFVKYTFWFVVAGAGLEILYGFGQLFGFIGNGESHFILGGSLNNPGAYAGYLSAVFPLILSVWLIYDKRHKKAENISYVLASCLILMFYLIIISQSRGAWIACSVGSLVVLNNKFLFYNKIVIFLNTAARKFVAVVCSVLLIAIAAYALYQYKADSAFGRLLVWKVALQKPYQNLIVGDGIGAFEANYGHWQSDYFARGSGSDAEKKVADYVTCAYNEPLQIFIEQGLLGVFLWAGVFVAAFRRKKSPYSPFILGAKASLCAIAVLSFVSYPFQTALIYLHFIICLAIIFHKKHTSDFAVFPKLQWICTVAGTITLALGFINLHGYKLQREGQKLVFEGRIDAGIEKYKEAYPILKDNGIFLFYYGSALALKGQYDESSELLEQSIRKTSNPNGYILLGNNYRKQGKYNEAESAYKNVIYQIPSKLFSKYRLVQLLLEQGRESEARQWANEILATKEKVPTTAAKEIKEEMRKLLQNELVGK